MDLFGDLPPSKVDIKPQENDIRSHKEEEKSDVGQKEEVKDIASTNESSNNEKVLLEKKKEDLNEKQSREIKSEAFVCSKKGRREYMQDAYSMFSDEEFSKVQKKIMKEKKIPYKVSYYGIFDGHAGDKVSNFAKQNLHILLMKNLPETILQDKELQKSITTSLTETFKTTDLAILKEGKLNGWKDGSTAIVSLIIDDTLFIANLGDCKAVLAYQSRKKLKMSEDKEEKESNKLQTALLTKDHSPMDWEERKRIQKTGAQVKDGRVNGILEVSRALGDERFKPFGVISDPDIYCRKIQENDQFLILACDGLWKSLKPSFVVDFISKGLQEQQSKQTICNTLVQESIKQGSDDNITAIIIFFENNHIEQ